MTRHALYNPDLGVTDGGLCISAFALVRRPRTGEILVLRPADHPRWRDDWAPNLRLYAAEHLALQWSLLRMPAAYLREGEHPRATTERVLREQLGLARWRVVREDVRSYHDESRRFPGRMHWDLAFVTEVETEDAPADLPWLAATAWRAPGTLRAEEFGSAHGDLAVEAASA